MYRLQVTLTYFIHEKIDLVSNFMKNSRCWLVFLNHTGPTSVQAIQPTDAISRTNFCEIVLLFKFPRVSSAHNSHFWARKYPHFPKRHFHNKFSVNVFCAMIHGKIVTPIYYTSSDSIKILQILRTTV